jgi:O-antigen/teichoic acid export membrane protein
VTGKPRDEPDPPATRPAGGGWRSLDDIWRAPDAGPAGDRDGPLRPPAGGRGDEPDATAPAQPEPSPQPEPSVQPEPWMQAESRVQAGPVVRAEPSGIGKAGGGTEVERAVETERPEPLVTFVAGPATGRRWGRERRRGPEARAEPRIEPRTEPPTDEGLDLWWTEPGEGWDLPGPNGSHGGAGDDLWAGDPPMPRAMPEESVADLWGRPEARAEAMAAPPVTQPAAAAEPAPVEAPIAAGPNEPNGEAPGFAPRARRRPQGHEVDDDRRSDLSRLARGGAINLVGAFANGAFGFLLVLVITRGFRPGVAGVFFEAIALFTILANVAELGADDGLIRNIPRLRALGRTQDLRTTVLVALGPVIAVGTVFGVCMYAFAPELSRLFVHKADHANALVPYLHVMAPFVPLSAASSSILSATRGFGTMLPTVYVDNFGKPGVRPLLVYGVLSAGLGTAALALAWAGPIVLGLAYAGFAMWRLLRRAEANDRPEPGPARPRGPIASEFWRFSAPRGLSAVFSVTVFWLDTLLLGAFKGSSEAGIYTAATRYVFLGFWALSAVQLVIAPMIAGLLTQGDHGRARTLYQTATQWLITPAFPIYLVLATFAPFLLGVFRPQYLAGQDALLILSLAMLVSTAAGPCMVVLLMGGKSTWTLMNSVFALTLNVVLNLLLIPRLGMEGAALAWTASIVANNVAGVVEVWFLLKLTPFSRAFPVIAGASLVLFGGLGVLVREVFGMTLASFAGYLAVATGLFLAVLYRFRGSLHLDILREAVRLRNQRQAARASQVPGRA